MTTLHDMTVAELAKALQTKQVSAVEVATAFLARTGGNPHNAFLDIDSEVTLAQAQASDARIAAGTAGARHAVLVDEHGGSRLEHRGVEFGHGRARGRDDRQCGEFLPDALNKFQPIHIGHHQIGNHQRHRLLLEPLQCLQTIGHRNDLKAVDLQNLLDTLAQQGLIFNKQNGRSRHHSGIQ